MWGSVERYPTENRKLAVALALLAVEWYEELDSQRLWVIKIPSREGEGYVRVPLTQNPLWYQQLCSEYEKKRKRYPKPRTYIKRINTLKALRRISFGNFRGVYAERIITLMVRLRFS